MKVSDIGEFRLIELLSAVLPKEQNDQLLIGIGDDASAWRSNETITLVTTDTLVQDIHFTTQQSWKDIGWKALAVNLSDIAAMGGIPQYALVALSIPSETEVEHLSELYQGMAELAQQFHVQVVGGNISEAPVVVITLTVIGASLEDDLLTRTAAVPGDLIGVTGYLGSSAAGQMMLSQDFCFESASMSFLQNAHLRPQPRIAEGQTLVKLGVRAAIDISDGLTSDLSHICKSSNVSARVNVDAIPINDAVNSTFPEESIGLALTGGEDYELLFTCKKDIMNMVSRKFPGQVTVIGEILEGESKEISLIDKDGKPYHWHKRGWEHFKSTNNH